MPFAKLYLKPAFIGYLARRFDRVLIALERFAHLGLAFKIKLVRAHAHAILIVNIFDFNRNKNKNQVNYIQILI